MWTGQNLLLFCHCRRWLGFLITAWPIFLHLCLFHVFLFPLCLVFSFTLEKECFQWLDLLYWFCPSSFVSFFVIVTNMERIGNLKKSSKTHYNSKRKNKRNFKSLMSDFTGTRNSGFLWNLFGEAKIAQKFLDQPFLSCTIFEAYLINSLRFYVFHSPR